MSSLAVLTIFAGEDFSTVTTADDVATLRVTFRQLTSRRRSRWFCHQAAATKLKSWPAKTFPSRGTRCQSRSFCYSVSGKRTWEGAVFDGTCVVAVVGACPTAVSRYPGTNTIKLFFAVNRCCQWLLLQNSDAKGVLADDKKVIALRLVHTTAILPRQQLIS